MIDRIVRLIVMPRHIECGFQYTCQGVVSDTDVFMLTIAIEQPTVSIRGIAADLDLWSRIFQDSESVQE